MQPNDPNNPGANYDWRDERRRRWEERQARRQAWREARFSHGGVYSGPGFHGRAFVGVVVLLLGIAFLLQNLGIFYVDRLWNFWPVLLIGFGLSRMFDTRRVYGVAGGLVLVLIGAVFLAMNLGYLPPNAWHLIWPFFLIFWGVVILMRGFGHSGRFGNPFVLDPAAVSSDVLHAVAVFGGIKQRVESQNFQGGEATAVFGGIELDLRPAAITAGEVRLEANAVFGGVEIMAPDTWDVIVRGSGVLGGYTDQTHPGISAPGVKRPRLIISGGAVFGGVNVRN